MTYQGSDGSSYAAGSLRFKDAQLGAECTPMLAEDGALRCLPADSVPGELGYFSDAGCTRPIMVISHITSPCAAPSYATTTLQGSPLCLTLPTLYRVFSLGTEVHRAYSIGWDQKCYDNTTNFPGGSTRYFEITAHVAPSSFVSFTKR